MHMKRNIWIFLGLFLTINAQALTVNIDGQGEIPAGGMELTINEAEEDILSGEITMKLEGTLVCENALTVTIHRSATELADEFCCAGQCKAGNEELEETLHFTPDGEASWFIHYTPEAGSKETMTYTFSDGNESRTLTVVFDYSTQGIESIQPSAVSIQKVLRGGIIYIIKDNKTYTIQ